MRARPQLSRDPLDGHDKAAGDSETQIATGGDTRIDRRTFCLLAANLALAARVSAQSPQLETLTQWLVASQSMRDGALQACIDRIRSLDGDIQAWVQVLSQKPTGNGALANTLIAQAQAHRELSASLAHDDA